MGAMAAGLRPIWGIEYDSAIAAVAARNAVPSTVADLLWEDPIWYIAPDWLHASPPCPNFSAAKTDAAETPHDIALASKVADFVATLRPRIFTLENVYAYRKSVSFEIILDVLEQRGYAVWRGHCNMADWGVPQTRKRLILIARRDGVKPSPPPKTHTKTGGLFSERWVGWYEAVADLIPSLSECALAPWQTKRLPHELRTLLVMTGNTSDAQARPGVGIVYPDAPANSVTASDLYARAVLVGAGGFNEEVVSRPSDAPVFTITANHNQATQLKAVLVSTNTTDGGAPPCRTEAHPAFVVDTKAGRGRAVLIDGKLSASGARLQIKNLGDPAATVVASRSAMKDARAILGPRVVRMTPRVYARWQTFPDSYWLPEDITLACRGLGNALPPRFVEQMIRSAVC